MFFISPDRVYITRIYPYGENNNVNIYANTDITIYRYVNIQRAKTSVGEKATVRKKRKEEGDERRARARSLSRHWGKREKLRA